MFQRFTHPGTSEQNELFATDIRPSIDALAPSSGRVDASVVITIEGRNFLPSSLVTFGDVPGLVRRFVDDTRIEVLVPQLFAPVVGPASVEVPVVVSDGVSESLEVATYTYVLPPADPPVAIGGEKLLGQ